MLTRDTVFQVSFEGYALLRNTKDNNGRALRRFLSRVSAEGMVLQVFTDFAEDLNDVQLARYAAYASEIREQSLMFMTGADQCDSSTNVDPCYSLVQNSYKLNCDIDTASVRQLQAAVANVLVLSDSMHTFAGSPAQALENVGLDAMAVSTELLQDSSELQQQAFSNFMRACQGDAYAMPAENSFS